MPLSARGLVVILNGEVVQDDGDVIKHMREEAVAFLQFLDREESHVTSLIAAWQTDRAQLRTALMAYQMKLEQLLTSSRPTVDPLAVTALAAEIRENTRRIENIVPLRGDEGATHGD